MKVEFKQLSSQAKIWIYTSKSKINEDQKAKITSLSDEFLFNWQSHDKPVAGYIQVIEDYFIMIAADDQGETLCGRAVDANVRLIKQIQEVTGLNLMDRMVVIYKHKGQLFTSDYNSIKKDLKLGKIDTETIVYNPMVSTIKEFNNSFEQRIENSWIA